MQPEWSVSFSDGFYSREGEPGREVTVGKVFFPRGESWHIPAVYLCPQGLVADVCAEIPPETIHTFLQTWLPYIQQPHLATRSVREKLEGENPLRKDFRAEAGVNGRQIPCSLSWSLGWIPEELLPAGERPDREARRVLNHYGLSPDRGWSIHRLAFPWGRRRIPRVKHLSLDLSWQPCRYVGEQFCAPPVGESAPLKDPATGKIHTLRTEDLQWQQVDALGWILTLGYALDPDLPAEMFQLRQEGEEISGAASVGIIAGADGPTTIFLREPEGIRRAYSSLQEAPEVPVLWQSVFRHKTREDVSWELI